MSIRRALKVRKKFTIEQRQFITSKKLDGENTATGWIDFLEELAEFDTYVDIARNRTRNIAIALGVISFIVFFPAMGMTDMFFRSLLMLFPFLTVVYIAIYFDLKRVDIPNAMRLFIFPLIRVLQEETKDETKIYVKVDFNAGLNKLYQTNKIDGTYDSSKKRKVDMIFYKYPILELKTKFADGTNLILTIDESARKNEIRKTNYRGKTKWKTKYKVKTTIDVTLLAKETAYQYLNAKNNTPQSNNQANSKTNINNTLINYSKKDDKHVLSSRRVLVRTEEESIPKLELVLGTIAKVYESLKAN